MAAADVLAIPSDYEAQPLVAWEAAACEVPLIATPVGRMGPLIDEHGCGILVDPTALAADLRQALVWMRDNPEPRREMGRRGRLAVAGETWASAVTATFRLWAEAGPRRPDEAPLVPGR